MGKLVGLLSSGVGLAMEATSSKGQSTTRVYDASRYERSTAEQSFHQDRQISVYEQSPYESQGLAGSQERYIDDIDTKLSNLSIAKQGGLPCPVIIPQRRPENRSRGWVRAYAPALMECGIDQRQFLNFLDGFNEASKASPYLDVINVAAAGVGFAPGITPLVISMVVPVAMKFAKQAQTKKQSSTYLDKMNAQLFCPHGLYAMVTTYSPEQQSQFLNVDTSSPSRAIRDAPGTSNGSRQNSFRSMNTTHSDFQLPESCPLIFPDPAPCPTDQPMDKFNNMSHFVADYYDRRAHARYVHDNPNSLLSIAPEPTFRSRWGDPSHPTNSGSLRSLITGAADDEQKGRRGRKKDREQSDFDSDSKDTRKIRKRRKPRLLGELRGIVTGSEGEERPGLLRSARGMVAGPGSGDQGLIKGLKSRAMNSDVLYLIIANMPTEGESVSASTKASSSRRTTSSPRRYTQVNQQGIQYAASSLDQQVEYNTVYANDRRHDDYYNEQQDGAPDDGTLPPPYTPRMASENWVSRRGPEYCVPTL